MEWFWCYGKCSSGCWWTLTYYFAMFSVPVLISLDFAKTSIISSDLFTRLVWGRYSLTKTMFMMQTCLHWCSMNCLASLVVDLFSFCFCCHSNLMSLRFQELSCLLELCKWSSFHENNLLHRLIFSIYPCLVDDDLLHRKRNTEQPQTFPVISYSWIFS